MGPIPEEQDTLAEILQENGYRTCLISSVYHMFKPSNDRVNKNVATTWQVEPFIKEIKDVDKILSLPYLPLKLDLSQFLITEKELGNKGIMGLSIPVFPNLIRILLKLLSKTQF